MPSRSRPTSVQLPRTLERPSSSKVSRAALLAASPDLGLLSVEDIRKNLLQNATLMLAGTSNLSPSHLPTALSKTMLPPYLGIPLIPSPTSIYPTHVLAIANTSPSNATDTHLVFPIHAPVLAAHCSKLPALPPPSSAVALSAPPPCPSPCSPLRPSIRCSPSFPIHTPSGSSNWLTSPRFSGILTGINKP
ncbi:hypothetical protein MIND_01306800 [Mycena indigotica]|uniref:Uncharacterized protein n=1 Tax=Mycena indigotica TaxID=2126181 RepID=A0A8H6S3J7_9AGAR|nr:uncharacterized protein MIND_01306800 [Mycena indigotica]KAF7290665.1 hypothetical protein MIND_01306800 [Mycena indigotica]